MMRMHYTNKMEWNQHYIQLSTTVVECRWSQNCRSQNHVKAYIRCHTIYLDVLGKTLYAISVRM